MACILVVDDHADSREMLAAYLHVCGHDPIVAENGLDALARLKRHHPAVIVLNLNMPVMDGFEFRRRQLAHPEWRVIPVICVTASYGPRRVQQQLQAECFAKPVDLAVLARRIDALTGEHCLALG